MKLSRNRQQRQARRQRLQALNTPHRWFAWHPVYTRDEGRYVWLERVWRVACFYEHVGGFRGWGYDESLEGARDTASDWAPRR